MPPTRTIKKKSSKMSGLKLSKRRSTILVGGNASGDMKLTPLWIHNSKRPRPFKNVNMDRLPVKWDSNKKAWMTTEVFDNWFKVHFLPEVRKFCRRKKIEFKILLILDNCSSHPDLSHLNENVEFLFLPPNTTSLIQPMDQGVIATLKALYKKITFAEAHRTHDTLVEFYQHYDGYFLMRSFSYLQYFSFEKFVYLH